MKKQELSELLLKWYNAHGRTLPWRVKGGAHPDPYVVLVSEFMLQQTTVKTVLDYFPEFLKRFPTAESLAAADLEEVYRYWQGLGYYTRARSLYATAQTVVNEFGGKFPQNREEVLKLKGIGAYTAASFLALAFNLPETVVDGNVIRIILPAAPFDRPGCGNRKPHPRKSGRPHRSKASGRLRFGDHGSGRHGLHAEKSPMPALSLAARMLVPRPAGTRTDTQPHQTGQKGKKRQRLPDIQCQRRNFDPQTFGKKGCISGLYEFPWTDEGSLPFDGLNDTGLNVFHVFTHIRLNLEIYVLHINSDIPPVADGFFTAIEKLSDYPFSTLMKKVCAKALPAAAAAPANPGQKSEKGSYKNSVGRSRRRKNTGITLPARRLLLQIRANNINHFKTQILSQKLRKSVD